MLTLIRATKSDDRQPSDDNYVLFDGDRCVGHIMRTRQAPQGKPWFWTIFAHDRQATQDRGYTATRAQALADFLASWTTLIGR